MQRLFSMFPSGPVGCALLVLRVALGIAFFFLAAPVSTLYPFVKWIAVTLALFLCVGFITPVCALICCVGVVFVATQLVGVSAMCSVLCACVAIAVGLLGPGGYSIDAVLFGRRRVALKRE